VVSVTPSGGWIPAVIAGRTGIGLSQRAQSFVLDPADNPYNVIAPGKQPRVTLTPSLALKDGRPSSPSPCRAATARTRTSSSSS
jgi:gamma-glutamyltranspeptidase / glutathione hydrolase